VQADQAGNASYAAAPSVQQAFSVLKANQAISFGALALSSIPVLHAIGSTVAAGAFATLVFAAMLSGAGIQFPEGKDGDANADRNRN